MLLIHSVSGTLLSPFSGSRYSCCRVKVYSQVSLQEPPQASHCTVVGKCSELILVHFEGVEEDKCWGKVSLVKTYQGKSKVLHGKSKWNWACSWRPAPLSRACQASRRRVWSLQVLHGSLSGLEVDLLLHMLAGPMKVWHGICDSRSKECRSVSCRAQEGIDHQV